MSLEMATPPPSPPSDITATMAASLSSHLIFLFFCGAGRRDLDYSTWEDGCGYRAS